jgi:hypothetical protein
LNEILKELADRLTLPKDPDPASGCSIINDRTIEEAPEVEFEE